MPDPAGRAFSTLPEWSLSTTLDVRSKDQGKFGLTYAIVLWLQITCVLSGRPFSKEALLGTGVLGSVYTKAIQTNLPVPHSLFPDKPPGPIPRHPESGEKINPEDPWGKAQHFGGGRQACGPAGETDIWRPMFLHGPVCIS